MNSVLSLRRPARAAFLGLVLCLSSATVAAQCQGKTGLALVICQAASHKLPTVPKIGNDALLGPVLNDLLDPNRQPVTSSFADARRGRTLPNDFTPGAALPLRFLPRNAEGAFQLRPGVFEGVLQSYCLKAGTHGPTKGDGYLPAPIEGPKAEVVRSILRQSVRHPEVRQQDIQVLLWAIIARTDFDHMPPAMQQTASKLLTRSQVNQLNGPLGRLPQALRQPLERKLQEKLNTLRGPLQRVVQAESNMRQHVSGSAPYHVMEQTAVLAGLAPDHASAIEPLWVEQPQGYFVRYLPSSYSQTKVQVYVPDSAASAGAPLTFDPSAELAMPANTGSQRLAMTGRPLEGELLPCNDTEVVNGADPGDTGLRYGYHQYQVENPICLRSTPGCTVDAVFRLMASSMAFAAPTDNTDPVSNCKLTTVDIPVLGQGTIRTAVNEQAHWIVNFTRRDHPLHPGRVVRVVVERPQSIDVVTLGDGNGFLPGFNELAASSLWGGVDAKLKGAFENRSRRP